MESNTFFRKWFALITVSVIEIALSGLMFNQIASGAEFDWGLLVSTLLLALLMIYLVRRQRATPSHAKTKPQRDDLKPQEMDKLVAQAQSLGYLTIIPEPETVSNQSNNPTVETLIDKLSDPDPAMRTNAALRLGDSDDQRAVSPLIKLLKDRPSDLKRRDTTNPKQAHGDWRILWSSIWNALTKPQDPYFNTRIAAARALGKMKNPRAIEPLFEAGMQDPSADVSVEAGTALVELGDPRAADVLIHARNLGPTWPFDAQAAYALARTGDLRSIPILISLLNMYRDDVQDTAVSGLVLIGKPSVLPLIVELTNGFGDLRGNACRALGELGDPSALPELDRLAKNAQESTSWYGSVQDLAADAARKIRAKQDTEKVMPAL